MKYASTTTLNRIREGSPAYGRACSEGWAKLLKSVGKTSGDDEPIDIITVLESNGLDDAIWVLSYAMPDDRMARHFQAWCADQVVHLTGHDPAVVAQIAMLRNDSATDHERAAALDAARAAARAAAWAAARADARAAAWAAARADARADARAAARAAARADARAAARADARAAARAAQEKQLRKMVSQ